MWPWIVAGVVVLLVAAVVYLEFFSPRSRKRAHSRELGAGLNHEALRAQSNNIRNQSSGL